MALLAIGAALVPDGYFIFFELVMRGQTPGKKAMKVRVLRDDGTPVTAKEVAVRNLLRIVEFLPAAYAVGTIAMFCSSALQAAGGHRGGDDCRQGRTVGLSRQCRQEVSVAPGDDRPDQFGADAGGTPRADGLPSAASRTDSRSAPIACRASGQAAPRKIRGPVLRRGKLTVYMMVVNGAMVGGLAVLLPRAEAKDRSGW